MTHEERVNHILKEIQEGTGKWKLVNISTLRDLILEALKEVETENKKAT